MRSLPSVCNFDPTGGAWSRESDYGQKISSCPRFGRWHQLGLNSTLHCDLKSTIKPTAHRQAKLPLYCRLFHRTIKQLIQSNCGGWHSAAHKSCPALKAKKQNLFHQKQQKSHADVLISRQKHQLDEIISLNEQVSEIAHLKSEFLALKTELSESERTE